MRLSDLFVASLVICLTSASGSLLADDVGDHHSSIDHSGVKILARSVATFLRVFSEETVATKGVNNAFNGGVYKNASFPPLTPNKVVFKSAFDPFPLRITTQQSANAWVDDFLRRHREDIKRLVGKIVLPPQKLRVGLASIYLSRGYLANLHTIFRIGNWELVRLDETGTKLQVNLLLGIDNVEAGYQCEAKLGLIGIRKWTRIRVDKVRIKIEMTQDFTPTSEDDGFEGENIVNLRAGSHIRLHLVGIHVDVRALGFPFDQIFSLIANAIANLFRSQIQNMIKNPIRDFIRKINGHYG